MELIKTQSTMQGAITTIDIVSAFRTLSVGEADNKELNQMLAKIYVLVGLRPHHYPSQEEDIILFAFIRKNYGHKTLGEMYLAFEKAMAGELDLEDYKVYDQFSCEYFARIMNAYRVWLKKQSSAVPPPKLKELPPEEVTEEDILEIAKGCADKNWQLIPVRAYSILLKQGSLVLTPDEKESVRNRVKSTLDKMYAEDPNLFSYTPRETMENNLSKKLAVKEYFSRA